MSFKILRGPEVDRLRGKSRSARYVDIEEELLTPGVSLGLRSIGWPEYEIEALNKARVAGKSDDQIRVLVRELVAARNAAA